MTNQETAQKLTNQDDRSTLWQWHLIWRKELSSSAWSIAWQHYQKFIFNCVLSHLVQPNRKSCHCLVTLNLVQSHMNLFLLHSMKKDKFWTKCWFLFFHAITIKGCWKLSSLKKKIQKQHKFFEVIWQLCIRTRLKFLLTKSKNLLKIYDSKSVCSKIRHCSIKQCKRAKLNVKIFS